MWIVQWLMMSYGGKFKSFLEPTGIIIIHLDIMLMIIIEGNDDWRRLYSVSKWVFNGIKLYTNLKLW